MLCAHKASHRPSKFQNLKLNLPKYFTTLEITLENTFTKLLYVFIRKLYLVQIAMLLTQIANRRLKSKALQSIYVSLFLSSKTVDLVILYFIAS